MLVCSANWLLPDDSLSLPPVACEIQAFRRRVDILAGRAGFRCDGRYVPVERVDLVLAGDMLDTLTSRRWHASLRPWHATPAADRVMAEVAQGCLRQGRRAIASLRQLCRRGVRVPSATSLARPSRERSVAVPVRVVIIAGDRDPRTGLGAFPASAADPWQTASCTRWGDHGEVFITHGHSLDPAAATAGTTEPRDPSLGESLAVDLIGRFLGSLGEHLQGSSWRALGRLLAAAHPLELPAVLSTWVQQSAHSCHTEQVNDLWKRAVARWHREARREPPQVLGLPVDVTARLAGWLERVPLGDEPATAAADLVRSLTADDVEIRSRLQAMAGVATDLIMLGHTSQAEVAAGTNDDSLAVVGLGGPPSLGTPSLPCTAVFEQGEHAGLRTATCAALSHGQAQGYAPLIVGGAGPAGIVDALRAA